MRDIRRPYNHSRYNQDLESRLEQFETRTYARDDSSYEEERPVHIPQKRTRRDLSTMDMYPRRRRDDIVEDEEYEDEQGSHKMVYRDPRTRYVGKNSSTGTWFFIVGVVVLSIGAFLLTYVFNRATITLTPKYADVLDFRKSITFTPSQESSGVSYILATTTVTKTRTLTLSETKKVEAKATGKITIYNNSDGEPQRLIKNTRFESTAGKIYRINQSVTVPGKTSSGPGTLEVTVFADSYGSDYNVSSTDFVVVGFKGTPREKTFYAKSKGAITGGSSGNVSLASLADLNAAKDELALELAQEIKAELLKVKREGYLGLYGASDITYSDNEQAVLSGQTGVYEVTATGYVILADAKELAKSIAQDVRDYANEDVRIGYNETLSFTRKITDKLSTNGTISILVEGKPRIIWENDPVALKELFKGKDKDEFKPLMKGVTGIESAEIGFSPMWLSKFPTNTDKISVVEALPKR